MADAIYVHWTLSKDEKESVNNEIVLFHLPNSNARCPPAPAIGVWSIKGTFFCSLPLYGNQNSIILAQYSLSTLPQLSERVHQGAERRGHLEVVPQQRHHPGRGDHRDYLHHHRYLV